MSHKIFQNIGKKVHLSMHFYEISVVLLVNPYNCKTSTHHPYLCMFAKLKYNVEKQNSARHLKMMTKNDLF